MIVDSYYLVVDKYTVIIVVQMHLYTYRVLRYRHTDAICCDS